MKKIILLMLISLSSFAQKTASTEQKQDTIIKIERQIRSAILTNTSSTGLATASLQSVEISTLTLAKKGIDTTNQTLRQVRTNSQHIYYGTDTINQNLRVQTSTLTNIYNKIDTSLMVFSKTYTLPVVNTNTVAYSAIIGTESSLSFTLNLGNYRYYLSDLVVMNLRGNYGTNINVAIFSDTLNLSNNRGFTTTNQRSERLRGVYNPIVSNILSPMGQVQYLLGSSTNSNYYTGIISIIPFWSTASGGALGGQNIRIRAIFKRAYN